jgi:hypothetical protein
MLLISKSFCCVIKVALYPRVTPYLAPEKIPILSMIIPIDCHIGSDKILETITMVMYDIGRTIRGEFFQM